MTRTAGGDWAFTARSLYGSPGEHSYAGAPSFMRRRYSRDLAGVDVAVSGVPFDLATTNRPGARFGPAAIRRASAQLAWGAVWPWGFDPFDRLAAIDYGDCVFDFGRPDAAIGEIEAHARTLLASGASMLTLGGDHFITLPLLRAHAARHGPLALVHFDAHADTSPGPADRIDHGTMFRRAAEEGLILPERSVQIGIRTDYDRSLPFTVLSAPQVAALGAAEIAAAVGRAVGRAKAYLTFDIDCLDPAYAPGTGTPIPGGLSSLQALAVLRLLGDIDFVGMDLVEVSPPYDWAEITALTAAQIALDYLCLLGAKRAPAASAAR